MTLTKIKFLAIALLMFPLVVVTFLQKEPLRMIARAGEETATQFKTKCAACHSPKAEKFIDVSKTDDVLIDAILNGRKGAKPPYMPEFKSKGMTAEQAKSLVDYIRQLRAPVGTDSNSSSNTSATSNVVGKANLTGDVSPNAAMNNGKTLTVVEDVTASFKAKCAACHSPKAEKFFDPSKTDEALVEIVLKGKKGDKPPYMPSFEAKGMTADEAKALVTKMRELRQPSS